MLGWPRIIYKYFASFPTWYTFIFLFTFTIFFTIILYMFRTGWSIIRRTVNVKKKNKSVSSWKRNKVCYRVSQCNEIANLPQHITNMPCHIFSGTWLHWTVPRSGWYFCTYTESYFMTRSVRLNILQYISNILYYTMTVKSFLIILVLCISLLVCNCLNFFRQYYYYPWRWQLNRNISECK
jgi:hypothetical protein